MAKFATDPGLLLYSLAMHLDTSKIRSCIAKAWPSRAAVAQFLSPRSKPKPIELFNSEAEIFRNATILVTDTRLAYIDPYDRTLQTYMFEHMISLDKRYYRSTPLNRKLCKGLLFTALVLFLIVLIIDLFDSTHNFLLFYIPLLASLLIGTLVWRDMRPKYKLEWRMRDGSTGRIATEPLLREWIRNSKRREEIMDNLALAMNKALSKNSWRASSFESRQNTAATDDKDREPSESEKKTKRQLQLVTTNYE